VGFYTPEYAKGLNVPGYHLHLITKDLRGGHILDFKTSGAVVQMDITPRFTMVLPTSGDFIGVNLSRDLQKELERIEK
jgi:acetolactate decarboxylase